MVTNLNTSGARALWGSSPTTFRMMLRAASTLSDFSTTRPSCRVQQHNGRVALGTRSDSHSPTHSPRAHTHPNTHAPQHTRTPTHTNTSTSPHEPMAYTHTYTYAHMDKYTYAHAHPRAHTTRPYRTLNFDMTSTRDSAHSCPKRSSNSMAACAGGGGRGNRPSHTQNRVLLRHWG